MLHEKGATEQEVERRHNTAFGKRMGFCVRPNYRLYRRLPHGNKHQITPLRAGDILTATYLSP